MNVSQLKNISKKDALITLSPIIALLICLLMTNQRSPDQSPLYPQSNQSFWFCFISLCASRLHVIMTVFRSHLNPQILKSRIPQIVIIPTVVLMLYFSNHWFFNFIGIIVLYWDMWHSAMQVYGFSRLYDFSIAENKQHSQNKYFKFSEILFSFSIVLIPHFLVLFSVDPKDYEAAASLFIGSEKSSSIFVASNIQIFYDFFYFLFFIAILNYVLSLIKRSQQNYQNDIRKYLLYTSIAVASFVSASRVTVLEMICLHNLYHALQYYLSLYYLNKLNVNKSTGYVMTFFAKNYKPIFMTSLIALFVLLLSSTNHILELPLNNKTWLIFSLLHFYADGFIWSVSKNEVSAH